jgi:hypothetical protein
MPLQSKPVIFFIGRFWQGASEAGIVKGLQDAGVLVQTFDTRHISGMPTNGIAGKLAHKAHLKIATQHLPELILREAKSVRPDVVMMIKRSELPREYLAQLRAQGTQIAMFYPDCHFDFGTVDLEAFEEFDHIFTTKSFQVDWLRNRFPDAQVQLVHHGFSLNSHLPRYENVTEADYRYNISYAGAYSKYKEDYLGKIIDALGDTEFLITGRGFEQSVPKVAERFDGVLRRNVLFSEFLQLSKVNLAFHSGPHTNGWQDLVSTRTFEIPATKGFMLHIDNDEVRSLYEVGSEIDVFKDPEECADKCRFYLERPELRQTMIEKAYQRSLAEHSYSHRAVQMLDLMGLKPA